MCLIPFKKNSGTIPKASRYSSTCNDFTDTADDSGGPSDIEFQMGWIRLIEEAFPEDLE
jgi:hypothetical protein